MNRIWSIIKGPGKTGMASTDTSQLVEMKERYIAAMVLAGTGDALGYKGGDWEFCHQGRIIHEELNKMGGLEKIKVNKKHWCVSDDTVMHRATAEALVAHSRDESKPKLYRLMAEYYKKCMNDMSGRAPGATCMTMTHRLNPKLENGYQIPFNPRGGGCGAAMRAMCIGLRYPRPEDIDHLIEVSIESGRMTHHHPTGYLGSLAAALFTAYSIQGKPTVEWAQGLLEVLEKAKEYVGKGPHSVENLNEWPYFVSKWEEYIETRHLDSGTPVFPPDYDNPDVRDHYYKKISFGGWGGASGHDSTIIAYDAILGSNGNWEELCKRGVFHGGDSDSTGTIAACCFGAMFGFEGVPKNNYENLEYRDRLEKAGMELYTLASSSKEKQNETETPVGAKTDPVKMDDSQAEEMNTQPPVESNKAAATSTTDGLKAANGGDADKDMDELLMDKDTTAGEKSEGAEQIENQPPENPQTDTGSDPTVTEQNIHASEEENGDVEEEAVPTTEDPTGSKDNAKRGSAEEKVEEKKPIDIETSV